MKVATQEAGTEGVLLACHEPARKVLIPLLLESLNKFNIMEQFAEVVCGFVNGVHIAYHLQHEAEVNVSISESENGDATGLPVAIVILSVFLIQICFVDVLFHDWFGVFGLLTPRTRAIQQQ